MHLFFYKENFMKCSYHDAEMKAKVQQDRRAM